MEKLPATFASVALFAFLGTSRRLLVVVVAALHKIKTFPSTFVFEIAVKTYTLNSSFKCK